LIKNKYVFSTKKKENINASLYSAQKCIVNIPRNITWSQLVRSYYVKYTSYQRIFEMKVADIIGPYIFRVMYK